MKPSQDGIAVRFQVEGRIIEDIPGDTAVLTKMRESSPWASGVETGQSYGGLTTEAVFFLMES
jgi:hypothetical protein